MEFYPTIWNVLHDGSIISIQGEIPGTVRLAIAIQYLREQFPDPGETIQITLTDCTWFAYREYKAQELCTDLPTIAASEPEILSAEMRSDISVVWCVGGTLEMCASGGSIALDSGRVITLQELIDMSEAYWTDLNELVKKARQEI